MHICLPGMSFFRGERADGKFEQNVQRHGETRVLNLTRVVDEFAKCLFRSKLRDAPRAQAVSEFVFVSIRLTVTIIVNADDQI